MDNLILLLPNLAPSEGYVAAPACQTFISVGYVPGALGLNDCYSRVIDHYRALGIPIHEQTRFGRTIDIEAGLVLSRIAPFHIGSALGYHFTPAYAAYRGFAGVLSIDGWVHDRLVPGSPNRTDPSRVHCRGTIGRRCIVDDGSGFRSDGDTRFVVHGPRPDRGIRTRTRNSAHTRVGPHVR